MTSKSIFIALIMLLSYLSNGQDMYDINGKLITQTLRGRVIDTDSHMPLTGVMIIVKDKELAGTTDEGGYYKIENVPVGRQTILVNLIGYKQQEFPNIMILSAKETILDIKLEESVIDLDEIVITANSKADPINDMATTSSRSFTIDETERYAGSWGDPSRMAINYAGVVIAGDQTNDIVIRGNSPAALIWQLDGIPIPGPNHFDNLGATGGPVSILNTNVLKQSDFFTGAFPAEYGNGYSGVFDLKMRNGNSQNFEFMGQLGFNGFEFGAEGPINRDNRSSFMINYRYSMLGLVDHLLWVEGLPFYQDVSYKLNFPMNKGNLSIFGFGGKSHISFDFKEDNETNTMNWSGKSINGSKTFFSGIKYVRFLSDKTRLENSFAYSTRRPFENEEFMINDILEEKKFGFEDIESKYILSVKLISKLNAKNTLQSGIRIENASVSSENYYHYVENDLIISEPYDHLSEDNLYIMNGFADYKHKFTDKFSFILGAHYQHFFYNNTYNFEPRAGIKYQFSEKSKIGFGYGHHSQLQPLFYYFLPGENGIAELNNELDFTKSHQLVLSYEYQFNKNLRFKVEAYYQDLYDIPVSENYAYTSMINHGQSDNMAWVDSLYNGGTGKNMGIDITFEKFLSNGYYFLFTGSLFDSKFKGADGIERNTVYNGNYVLNALGGYEINLSKKLILDFNIRTVYAGGKRYVPINLEETIIQDEWVYHEDRAYEAQMKDYFRLDFRVGLVIQGKRFSHEIGFDITNLTGHQNEYYHWYDSDTQSIMTEYQQGFFPMGLYRIRF
jgi:hypothetical protein